MLVASQVHCPTCGAPLKVQVGQRHVICVFCNTSSLIHATTSAAAPQLTPETVSKEDIERIKQLVLDGKRDEAIDLYAQKTNAPRNEAEVAVNDMLLSEYWKLTRALPINGVGIAAYCVMIAIGFVLAGVGVMFTLDGSPAYIALILGGLLFTVWRIASFVPKALASWTSAYGARGQAKVLKVAIFRTFPDCVIGQVMFEVTPESGGQPFIDEEILMIGPASLAKLTVGNIILVRFDEPKRQRVFPTSPIQVVGTASGYR